MKSATFLTLLAFVASAASQAVPDQLVFAPHQQPLNRQALLTEKDILTEYKYHEQSQSSEKSFTASPKLRVDTRFGPVQGIYAPPTYSEKTVRYSTAEEETFGRAFLGIPFAQKPLGPDGRFKYARKWTQTFAEAYGWHNNNDQQVLRADRFAPCCLQVGWGNSEDCLYLNIFTPPYQRMELFTQQRKLLPVMVWLYGGAFEFGGAGAGKVTDGNPYSGNYVVQHKDVLIVSVNHRVGPMGYLRTGNLTGNYGISDQAESIQWVIDNIKDFGGDPDHITVFGMSSGAYISSLLAFNEKMPKVKGVISMSGPQSSHPKTDLEALRTGHSFMEKLGCKHDDIKCVEHKSPFQLVLASTMATDGWMENVLSDSLKWFPVQDDLYCPARPMDLIANPTPALKRRLSNMDIMLGTAKNEASLFVSAVYEMLNLCVGCIFLFLRGDQSFWEYFMSWLAGDKYKDPMGDLPGNPRSHVARQYTRLLMRTFRGDTKAVERIVSYYPPTDDFASTIDALIRLITEYMFTCPSHTMAESLAKHAPNANLYMYEVEHSGSWVESLFGPNGFVRRNTVAHAFDVLFFWNFSPALPKGDAKISSLYTDYFTSLAYGNPNDVQHPTSLFGGRADPPVWTKWTAKDEAYMVLGDNSSTVNKFAEMRHGTYHTDACKFWATFRGQDVRPGTVFPF